MSFLCSFLVCFDVFCVYKSHVVKTFCMFARPLLKKSLCIHNWGIFRCIFILTTLYTQRWIIEITNNNEIIGSMKNCIQVQLWVIYVTFFFYYSKTFYSTTCIWYILTVTVTYNSDALSFSFNLVLFSFDCSLLLWVQGISVHIVCCPTLKLHCLLPAFV